jgi:hypothetical protein
VGDYPVTERRYRPSHLGPAAHAVLGPIRHFFTDITATMSRGYVPRGTYRAERSDLQS